MAYILYCFGLLLVILVVSNLSLTYNIFKETEKQNIPLIVNKELEDIEKRIKTLVENAQNIAAIAEKTTERRFGEVTTLIKNANDKTDFVTKSINNLNSALGDTRIRGQLGEKIAEDILQALGYVEGINYIKQSKEVEGIRPDFTFPLPSGIRMNMDSKFPLNNYLKYHNTTSENDKKEYLKKFLKDIRDRLKEITTKEYINPLEGTTDFAIIFIPSDAVLWFVMSNDPEFIDYALENKIVVCSPWSLYVILSVVRHSSQLYKLDKATAKGLKAIQLFRKEWGAYKAEDAKIDKKLGELETTRDSVVGVRTRQLDKILADIDRLGEFSLKVED